MNRKIVLIFTALLILLSVGCARLSEGKPMGESTSGVTDATGECTHSQSESRPQTTVSQDPTEQTQASTSLSTEPSQSAEPSEITQPTQNEDVLDVPEPTQIPVTTTPDVPTVTETQPQQEPDSTIPVIPPEETQESSSETEQPDTTECRHDYQQTYTKAATCTTEGSKKFTCRKCGAVMRQQIPMKAHTYQTATCLNPKTCTGCARTEGTALGHNYGPDQRCTRCGVKNPAASPESMPVDFVVTIRSDEGVALAGVTVAVYTEASGTDDAGSAVTNEKGMATIALAAGSSQYTVKLANVPEGYQAQESYSFDSPQITINLKSLPVRSDPNDHSKARYEEGDRMMEFTVTDVDGNTYQLSELLQEKKLVILDFWYVSCNPCKQEFPYFETALDTYGEDIVLLAIDPIYAAEDIRQLRDQLGLSFPVFQDPLGLSEGFHVQSYPTTVFIDSNGVIRRIHRGAFSNEDAFLRAIAAYI